MKYFMIFTAACSLFYFGCLNSITTPVKNIETIQPRHGGTGLVLIYDLSLSDTFLKPDTETLKEVLRDYATPCVSLTGIHVLTESIQQQPWLSQSVCMDTLPLPANFILAKKQRQANQKGVTPL